MDDAQRIRDEQVELRNRIMEYFDCRISIVSRNTLCVHQGQDGTKNQYFNVRKEADDLYALTKGSAGLSQDEMFTDVKVNFYSLLDRVMYCVSNNTRIYVDTNKRKDIEEYLERLSGGKE